MPEVNLHESFLLAYSTLSEGNMDERFSDRSVVMQNRRKFYNKFGINPRFTIEGKQTHSDRILLLDSENAKMWYGMNIPGVDGFITNEKEVNIIIKVADCVPVVIYDPVQQAYGLIHVGWKGAVKRIHEKAVTMLQDAYGCEPANLLVWLGPSAQKCCFTSAEKPKQSDEEIWDPYIVEKNGSWTVDIPGFIANSMQNLGIPKKKIQLSDVCTVETEDLFSNTRAAKTGEPEGRFIVLTQLK